MPTEFADRGFAGVSVQEIADRAGTHKTTVLYHFATKEALHDAVLEEALGSIAETMQEFLAGEFRRERVAYLLDQIHGFFADHLPLARLLQRELLDPAATDAYMKRFVEPIYLPALAGFKRAMAEGVIRDIDPALFIHDAHVQLIGYFCHRDLLERRPLDRRQELEGRGRVTAFLEVGQEVRDHRRHVGRELAIFHQVRTGRAGRRRLDVTAFDRGDEGDELLGLGLVLGGGRDVEA